MHSISHNFDIDVLVSVALQPNLIYQNYNRQSGPELVDVRTHLVSLDDDVLTSFPLKVFLLKPEGDERLYD